MERLTTVFLLNESQKEKKGYNVIFIDLKVLYSIKI